MILTIGLFIGLTVASSSCMLNTEPLETEADILAFITEIHPGQNGDSSGQISVESHADKIVSKYTVTIKTDTLIFQQDGENLTKVTFSAFESQQWVNIWFTGPILESWPMQGTAKQVVITE